jgi:hypothetical protein
MKLVLPLILSLIHFAPLLFSQKSYTPTPDALTALRTMTTGSVIAPIRFLSHDLLEGRAPGSRGDLLARTYIAAEMEQLGLKPGSAEGTFVQRVPIVAMRTSPSTTLSISRGSTDLELKFGSEFIGFSAIQQERTKIQNAEIVFVGFGIVAPEQGWDDYKGVDVKGKVILMLNNDPPSEDPRVFGGSARTYYGRWTYKYEIAEKKGALGALIIHTTESAGYGWQVVQTTWSGNRFQLASDPGESGTLLNGWLTHEATERVLKLSVLRYSDLEERARKKSFTPVPLGLRLSTTINSSLLPVETSNIIGVLPGRDPQLKNEAVIFTAHYDHLGIVEPVNGDSIANGAMDNAAGVSGLLNVARAFSSLPEAPRRSIVFAAVGAEESGLIGSAYYASRPTFPPERIAANINIDGMNIFGRTRDIIMIGLGKSSLDETLRSAATWQNRTVMPDPFPELGLFYRSDQFNFAKIGVPCMFLRAGMEYIGKPPEFGREKSQEYVKYHYHQPSDEITDQWDMSGAVEDLQLMFLVGLAVADDNQMPAWNRGDEFESARTARPEKR